MKEKIIDILEKHYHRRNHIENRCADELLDLFSVVGRSEQLFCFECGNKRELIVETDINSGRICKNRLCKAK
jgi:hypothetical protein